jgi:glycosyltransferase involved in cell wall biosynthesis
MPGETKQKISICIPTFNRSDLLKKTLLSAANQTVKPWEVIVVDNYSSDDTQKVVSEFKEIKYFRNKVNLGMIDNWNRCIELSSGDFLTLLHSDDLISPQWYEYWQEAIGNNNKEGVGAYFSAVFTIDSKENAKIVYRVFSRETLLSPAEPFKKMWPRHMCSLPASAAIIYRKSIFEKLGRFNPAYSTESDIAFPLKMLNKFYIYYTPKLIFAYRIHPFQSFDTAKKEKDYEKKYSTLSRHLSIFKEFYDNELPQEYKTPLFYKHVCCMYIAIAIFNLLAFRFGRAKKYYTLTKAVFPDTLNNAGDLLILASLISHYINKLIRGRIEALAIRNTAKGWLSLKS